MALVTIVVLDMVTIFMEDLIIIAIIQLEEYVKTLKSSKEVSIIQGIVIMLQEVSNKGSIKH